MPKFQKGDNTQQKRKRGSSNPPPAIELTVGRPSSYKPEFDEAVRRLRLLMMTKEEIARFFGVSPNTLDLWGQRHPSFKASYAQGGEIADAEIVDAMRHRALGYSHRAEKIMLTREGEIIREEYTEHYPPDVAAGSLLLANRQRGRWKLKPDDAAGDAGVTVNVTGGLPDE